MSELAEKLRAWVEACKVFEDASTRRRETHDAVPEEYHYADRAKDYLRGYDDATDEMDPYIEKLERRVEELEAQIAAQPQPAAVEGCTVRAVGVVGSVRWGRMDVYGDMACGVSDVREVEEKKAASTSIYNRVVAIVDPDDIVMLASKQPKYWEDENCDRYHSEDEGKQWDARTTLYPGLAQPAQERAE